jgi:hypothetical protein
MLTMAVVHESLVARVGRWDGSPSTEEMIFWRHLLKRSELLLRIFIELLQSPLNWQSAKVALILIYIDALFSSVHPSLREI